MFDKWLNLPAHLYLRIIALLLIAVGLTLSNVLMSIGTIWLLSNWILEGDFAEKWKRIRTDKSIWLVLFLFFFGILSVLWSDDKSWWFQDARLKLPFVVIPFVLGSSTPLSRGHFLAVLYCFLGVTALTTGINVFAWFTSQADQTDIRAMSLFISHIRLAAAVALALFCSLYLILIKSGNVMLWVALIAWFVIYSYMAGVMNGYVLILVLMLMTVLFLIIKMRSVPAKWAITGVAIGLLTIVLFNFWNAITSFRDHENVEVSELPEFTENSNPYLHDTSVHQFENGKYIWVMVCQSELESEWNKRSAIDYDSVDKKGQPMFGTLLHYMTSKGMNKDSAGVWQLTELEIGLIENGRTSANPAWGLGAAVHSFLWQYQLYLDGGDPNGHSLLQRIEHLKIAMCVLKKNWVLGVGTGDLPAAFENCYDKMNSQLIGENRHRAHNEFLSIWMSHGLIGLVAFTTLLLIPVFRKNSNDYFSFVVCVVLIVSCLFEDMIETQAGVTLFSFFLALALYRQSASHKGRQTVD